jgi:phosphohistidine phosphatase
MMRLTILRHAKSSRDEPNLDDHNRPLNERGWKAARRMGRELGHRGLHFDYVLASTAARVRETIDGLAEKYDFSAPIRFEPRLYMADAGTLLDLVRALPDDAQSALLVGHNPGLERLAVELSHDDRQALRHRVSEKFPTAALAVVELPAESWAEVQPGSGEIVELILPRELGD